MLSPRRRRHRRARDRAGRPRPFPVLDAMRTRSLTVAYSTFVGLRRDLVARTLTDLAVKDGEAAVLWFYSMLERVER